jgi:hypothetical protein
MRELRSDASHGAEKEHFLCLFLRRKAESLFGKCAKERIFDVDAPKAHFQTDSETKMTRRFITAGSGKGLVRPWALEPSGRKPALRPNQ